MDLHNRVTQKVIYDNNEALEKRALSLWVTRETAHEFILETRNKNYDNIEYIIKDKDWNILWSFTVNFTYLTHN